MRLKREGTPSLKVLTFEEVEEVCDDKVENDDARNGRPQERRREEGGVHLDRHPLDHDRQTRFGRVSVRENMRTRERVRRSQEV